MRYQQLHEEYLQRTAADLAPDRSAPIQDQLAELGLTEDQIAKAVSLIESESERVGFHFAARSIREVFQRCGGISPAVAAVAYVVSLRNEMSLAECAAQFTGRHGLPLSKQSVGNHLPRVYAALEGLVDAPTVGNDQP